MIRIPQYFKNKAIRQFGDRGPARVDSLPRILHACVSRWGLSDLHVISDLSINFLCSATSPRGEVVLKISGPHSERLTEMVARKLYKGRNACRCIDTDTERGAMLLERIIPGDCLRDAVPEDEPLRIGSRLVRDLPIPVDGDVSLPSYSDWINAAYRSVREGYKPSECFKRSMRVAARLFSELPNERERSFLLHGDLRHDNILLDVDGSWRAIDPQGVIGLPLMECGRFIQNHSVDDENNLDLEKAASTVDYMATVLDESKRRVWIAFLVLHVLSFCWGFEMNLAPDVLEQGADECAVIRPQYRIVKSAGRTTAGMRFLDAVPVYPDWQSSILYLS